MQDNALTSWYLVLYSVAGLAANAKLAGDWYHYQDQLLKANIGLGNQAPTGCQQYPDQLSGTWTVD